MCMSEFMCVCVCEREREREREREINWVSVVQILFHTTDR